MGVPLSSRTPGIATSVHAIAGAFRLVMRCRVPDKSDICIRRKEKRTTPSITVLYPVFYRHIVMQQEST
ncbi:MAG: hypothetical protein LUQ04_03080 [Methanoregula sp.]|nr:hypothetical protein [Methanoregula sp.]